MNDDNINNTLDNYLVNIIENISDSDNDISKQADDLSTRLRFKLASASNPNNLFIADPMLIKLQNDILDFVSNNKKYL